MPEHDSTWNAVERAARNAYGRLVASLAYRFRDIAAAEDALGDALRAALVRWPETGVPESPEAWLMAVAKNQLRAAARHRAITGDPQARAAIQELASVPEAEGGLDPRLRLMFVCAHPAIDPSIRTPLMLQTVLGLDAARIGEAFCVSASAMGQRLVRAKQKIRDASVPFDPPETRELPERLGAVLEGVYAAFGLGWDDAGLTRPNAQRGREPLDEEALFLARLLVTLVPSEPETLGLLALMTFSHARRRARFDARGAFVPLARHDVALWDREAIVEAEKLLWQAASMRRPGPFQLEAAVQSAHCQRLFSGKTPWGAIATIYGALNQVAPTVGTCVAHAAALSELGRLEEATARLNTLPRGLVESYAPYWVVSAQIARLSGDLAQHQQAMQRALVLTTDPAVRLHLEGALRDADA